METQGIAIPVSELSADALRGVVENFVLREGTDYGARECSLAEKVTQVLEQLRRGEAQILFDPESNSVTIAADTRSGTQSDRQV